jgi:hypothetical protein
MVMVPLSSARAGREKIKASIMAATMLVITDFIYLSKSDEPLLTVLGQSFSNKSTVIKCYNPLPVLVKTLPPASQMNQATAELWRTATLEDSWEILAMPYPVRSKSAR